MKGGKKVREAFGFNISNSTLLTHAPSNTDNNLLNILRFCYGCRIKREKFAPLSSRQKIPTNPTFRGL
jgi:hypothetical protein